MGESLRMRSSDSATVDPRLTAPVDPRLTALADPWLATLTLCLCNMGRLSFCTRATVCCAPHDTESTRRPGMVEDWLLRKLKQQQLTAIKKCQCFPLITWRPYLFISLFLSLFLTFFLSFFWGVYMFCSCVWRLRLLDTYASEIAKICNFWTFRLVIQLIKQLFKIRQRAFLHNVPWSIGQKGFLSEFEKMVY